MMRLAARRAGRACALLAVLMAAGHAHAQDVVRCRSGRIINVGMMEAEILSRCGEPKSRTVEEVPVLHRNIDGTVARTNEVTRTERWLYERGQGQFDASLTFENGKLKRIELLTQPSRSP